MTRQEFLHELKIALQGELSQSAVDDNLKYYNDYILGESRKGVSEEEVLISLGSPRLIAKTLVDTNGQYGAYAGGYYSAEDAGQAFQEETGERRKSHSGHSGRDGWEIQVGRFKLNSWYGKLLLLGLLGAALIVVVNVVAFLLPVLAPVILVLLVCSMIFGNRR